MKRHDYIKYFTIGKRESGDEYTILRDDRPEALWQLVYAVHESFSAWPNDWIYGQIIEALDELEDSDIDDITIEHDIYYRDLSKWLYDNGFAAGCVQEAIDDEYCDGKNFWKSVESGQWLAKDQIYRQVNEWLEVQIEEAEHLERIQD